MPRSLNLQQSLSNEIRRAGLSQTPDDPLLLRTVARLSYMAARSASGALVGHTDTPILHFETTGACKYRYRYVRLIQLLQSMSTSMVW